MMQKKINVKKKKKIYLKKTMSKLVIKFMISVEICFGKVQFPPLNEKS